MGRQHAERVDLAVSTVIFALRPSPDSDLMTLWLPLVRRIREPYEGRWALPGGWLSPEHDLETAARATLGRTTGLTPRYLEQLYAFGTLDRSADDTRVVSIVYWALVHADEAAQAIDSDNVEWFAVDDLPELAFDHRTIVDYAVWRLRTKMEYSRIAHGFLGETFTLAQLRQVHEAVRGCSFDPANFRRQILATGSLVDTGEHLTGTSHRPPRLYRYDTAVQPADHGPLTPSKEQA
ncbi:NUDIX domain-containing protein [Luteipulveratus sp. YIM 133132]|uniref:NUDIX domain-containing protein n=1 Tax=Luteipulveratus flavus TaxID=3031728 RepID=A0ABT6CAL4_9MICO|nr:MULTISPECIES: NUDIX domain-containing protein [unclassified Luteipulveratus]MDE9365914.1 NUDIX domain-containing protein [Luteipulveratus sp. YIM 133132]MDF8265104.1 NUDIX domain-containing protein [Luteipulveratus sp. YIM 133296]